MLVELKDSNFFLSVVHSCIHFLNFILIFKESFIGFPLFLDLKIEMKKIVKFIFPFIYSESSYFINLSFFASVFVPRVFYLLYIIILSFQGI